MTRQPLALFPFLIFICLSFSATAQTEDELREKIRQEVREELRQEKIRKDEIELQRLLMEREEQIVKNRLILEQQIREEEMKKAKRDDAKPKDSDRNSRRLTGWNISAHFGPNIPLGRFSSKAGSDGHFAALGAAVAVNNGIQFGRVMGINVGFGFDYNPIDEYAIMEALRSSTNIPQGVNLSIGSKSWKQYTVQVGPVIRAIGHSVSFRFVPYIGINVIDGGDYSITLSDLGVLERVSANYNTSTAFLVGTDLEFGVHLGRSSDLTFGLHLNMSWRKVGYMVTSTSEAPQHGWEEMELIRLAPMIGYRFNL